MSLTRSEKNLLSKIQFVSQTSITAQAKVINISERSLRNSLQKFEKLQLVRRSIYINFFALGYSNVLTYFNVSPSHAESTRDLIDALSAQKKINWIAQIGGDYQYGMSLLIESHFDLHALFSALGKKYQPLFKEKSMIFQTACATFPNKCLGDAFAGDEEFYTSEATTPRIVIDELDARIIQLLCLDSNTSLRELGAMVGKSHSAVEGRIERLKESGVILGEYYKVDINKLGYNSYKLMVYTKGPDPIFATKLREFSRHHRSISSLNECLGEWDFEIGADSKDPNEISTLVQELQHKFSKEITGIKSTPVFNIIKNQYCQSAK